MASIMEIQDMTTAQSNQLMQVPECCDVNALQTIMEGFQPLLTPPLSPESSPEYTTVETPTEDKHAEAMLDQMLECEQIPTFDDTDSYTDSQTSYDNSPDAADVLIPIDPVLGAGASWLIQDCMWNSHAYEPRNLIGNGGVCTPAPSPPPEGHDKSSEEEDEPIEEEVPEEGAKESNEEPSTQAECISPCDIFPTYTLVIDKEGNKVTPKTRSTTTNLQNDSTRHTQAMSSESEEEIDVVTVTERVPTRMSTRKRQFSVSAPCSRQTSPEPSSPKKRKYPVKRLQRISSTCSSVGDGTESDDEHRRASHNILERKRRNDLKYSFQVLREQVPELEDNQRAPKVTILRKAAEYIKQIQTEGNAMEQELKRERERELKLRQRLAFLKVMG